MIIFKIPIMQSQVEAAELKTLCSLAKQELHAFGPEAVQLKHEMWQTGMLLIAVLSV